MKKSKIALLIILFVLLIFLIFNKDRLMEQQRQKPTIRNSLIEYITPLKKVAALGTSNDLEILEPEEALMEVPTQTEPIVEKQEVEPEPVKAEVKRYDISSSDRKLIASLIYLEGRGESYECQKMIASVIFNRYDAGRGSFSDIIFAKNQFSPASLISSTTPTDVQYSVVDDICKNGVSLPPYVMYFRMGYHHNWKGYVGYTILEDTYFGYNHSDRMKMGY